MAAPILPQDVAEHLEAAIELSNRRVHLRFLDEAEALLSREFPATAVVIAGVVLESLLAGQRRPADPRELKQIEQWSELRNTAIQSHTAVVTLDQAREMVAGVRWILLRRATVGPRLTWTTNANAAPKRVRGKYKFVPTSSADFIARKADELKLEDDGRGH